MKKFFVVTNPEQGWDCVVGLYEAESKEAVELVLCAEYEINLEELKNQYVIHKITLTKI